ncbi:hypothetical protein Leryth_005120 [Lithospermum erythrorhizon]|uniref:SAUR family protein n=1 Tax=Lithospermum erythrorhizon TaxID=34254 RepID=A0AAV3PZG7_LITER|nr:hypothetical protein Leryth_005120 [Lithospermum erythrorhizon]
MKKLIRRLSRVADSAHCSITRSPTATGRTGGKRASGGGVPEGHLPVCVGEEMERFIVSAEVLNHPIFVKLLNKSAQVYGYEQEGALRIPCHVFVFERVLEAVRIGGDVQDLLNSLSEEIY